MQIDWMDEKIDPPVFWQQETHSTGKDTQTESKRIKKRYP
jgi:hypothetical protein